MTECYLCGTSINGKYILCYNCNIKTKKYAKYCKCGGIIRNTKFATCFNCFKLDNNMQLCDCKIKWFKHPFTQCRQCHVEKSENKYYNIMDDLLAEYF